VPKFGSLGAEVLKLRQQSNYHFGNYPSSIAIGGKIYAVRIIALALFSVPLLLAKPKSDDL
jgi:hypothetical protein